MSNDSVTIYKLMILYLLSKVSAPLPEHVISDYITGHGYTNYFIIQDALGGLLQTEMISEDRTYQRSYYVLNDTGRKTLKLFGNRLSYEIRQEITAYLKENQYELLNETAVTSDYKITADGSYLTVCTIREGEEILFSLSLSVPTENDARKICGSWQNQCAELYQQALRNLLKNN